MSDSASQHWRSAMQAIRQRVETLEPQLTTGRLVRATGLVLEAVGLRLPVGASCLIELGPGMAPAEAEVVGFADQTLYLMPIDPLSGVAPGAKVIPLGHGNVGERRYPVGDALLGRVVDGVGRPLDGLGPLEDVSHAPLEGQPLNPLERAPIDTPLDVGIRAINALLSVGRGQRMGLFAGSGVGKSVLLGMMARFTNADVIVVGLIGERGREVQEFIEHTLGEEGLKRAVVVATPADMTPLHRLKGASYATRIAESLRDQGRDVLLIMDSLTRYAMAQREIALAIGEPPATKGYPPSVFAKLPALVERTGNGRRGGGSITAFYTVLTEGDDQQDPIADSARAILDGHIVLSRRIAESGHYPAIDIEASISRAMSAVAPERQLTRARRFKQLYSSYQRNQDLIAIGAYQPGSDKTLDNAVRLHEPMGHFLQQATSQRASLADSTDMLKQLLAQQ